MQTKTELMAGAATALASRLGDGWTVRRADGRLVGAGLPPPDEVWSIVAPDREEALQCVVVLGQVYPRDIRRWLALSRAESRVGNYLLVADYLTPGSREILEEAGVNYIDAAGNVLVRLSRPAVLLRERANGARRPSNRGQVRSLRGGKAARIVRSLCDFALPFSAYDLASMAGTTPGYVSKVLALLDLEALVERRPRGPLEVVDWPALLRRWAVDYGLLSSNTCRLYLAPQGIIVFQRELAAVAQRAETFRYAFTGSFAASRLAPVAPPSLLFCYVDDTTRVAEETKLIAASGAGNVYLCEPFDPVVFERTWEEAGSVFAALSQVAVDCLTGPDRMPSEGEALIEWMAANERAWRGAL
jgi:hypothetical protein